MLNSTNLDDFKVSLETNHLSALLLPGNPHYKKNISFTAILPPVPRKNVRGRLIFLRRAETTQVTNVQQESGPRTQASNGGYAWLQVEKSREVLTHGSMGMVYLPINLPWQIRQMSNVGIHTIHDPYMDLLWVIVCFLKRRNTCGHSIIKWHVTFSLESVWEKMFEKTFQVNSTVLTSWTPVDRQFLTTSNATNHRILSDTIYCTKIH